MSALRSWCGALFLGAALACTLPGAGAERTEAPATALATFRGHLNANHRAPPASCARVDAQALEDAPSVEGLSYVAADWVRRQHARTRGLSTCCFAALDEEFRDAAWGPSCVLKRLGPSRNGTLFVGVEAKAAAVRRALQGREPFGLQFQDHPPMIPIPPPSGSLLVGLTPPVQAHFSLDKTPPANNPRNG